MTTRRYRTALTLMFLILLWCINHSYGHADHSVMLSDHQPDAISKCTVLPHSIAKQPYAPTPTSRASTNANKYNGADCGSNKDSDSYHSVRLSYPKAVTITGNANTAAVQFAALSAEVSGGILFVNWSTTSEKNNKSFDVEAASDKMHFITIGEVQSLDDDGNSSSALSYKFSADLSGVAMANSGLLVAFLALGGLTMGLQRKRKLLFAGLMLAGICLGTIGCQKKASEPVSGNTNAYIRIAQIDQNGSKTYSKIVKVVNNN